jgi:hypothetical protein
MASAGATYVGSATLPDNYPRLIIDQAAADAIAALPTARLRRLATDFAVNQRFRRDLFLRGAQLSTDPAELIRRIDDLVVGCVTEIDQIGPQATIPRGRMTFQEEFIRELRDLMNDGAMRMGDIVERLGGKGRNAKEIRQNLVFLVAAGTLMPFAQAGGIDQAAAETRTTTVVVTNALEQIVQTGTPAVVPCERVGNGVLVGPNEARQALDWRSRATDLPPSRLRRLGLVA